MEQENMSRTPSAPATPLRQISADRMNQMNQTNSVRIPQSPSVPIYLSDGFDTHPSNRRDSDIARVADVRSKIAFLNNLAHGQNGSMATNSFSIPGSPTRSPAKTALGSPNKSHSRANSTMSLLSGQSDLAALVDALQSQLEQSRNRERLVSERVESMMEQLSNAHSRARHEKQAYEKELKSVNKMQYKSELALIRCQEELREARNESEGFKIRAEHERLAKDKSRQDAFERARTLASNIEELEVVKRERDMLRNENDSLHALQESMVLGVQDDLQVREVAVQTVTQPIQEQYTAPECICSMLRKTDQEPTTAESEVIQELQEELDWIKCQLKREQDLIYFMNMQCQFRACPCRQAEKHGVRFVHDYAYDHNQQAMAHAKGTKRKAEDELPVPRYITFRESLVQKSREREMEVPDRDQYQNASRVREDRLDLELDDTERMSEQDTTPRASEGAGNTVIYNATEAGVIPLHEAADIPLPSPRSDDLEPTALLEDMTQLIVEPEPAATARHFAFSTSLSSRNAFDTKTPILSKSHSATSVDHTEGLFDIVPSRHLPPRPSTVMGFRPNGSPIRMVPPSPQQDGSYTPSISPPRYRAFQVPVKDGSPLRKSVTQQRSRSQSKTRNQERIKADSPAFSHGNSDAHSPLATTYFPVTPKAKQDRQGRVQVRVQPSSQYQVLQSQPQTTTTMVPLRGLEEDDIFSPEKNTCVDQNVSAQFAGYSRGRQPLAEGDTNTHQNMLPGTPITREAALAQIRARRDRARSINNRKQANAGKDEEAGRVKTPKSVARRGVMLNRDGRDISNLSQASAPARF